MYPYDRLESQFIEQTSNRKLPEVLPHHLFMLAAISAAKKETGLYPLTTMDTSKVKIDNRIPLTTSLPTKSPESKLNNNNDKNKKEDEIQTIKEEEEEDSKEIRRIIQITCAVKSEDGSGQSLALLLRFEDKMNRQLSCTVGENETALDLANELVQFGLINELDRDIVTAKINENLTVPA